jgi:hypothetical protein
VPATTKAKRPAKSTARYRHSVYVIELDDRVLNHRRFRDANPGYDIMKPCL